MSNGKNGSADKSKSKGNGKSNGKTATGRRANRQSAAVLAAAGSQSTVCPRCDSTTVGVMVTAPVDDAWVMYVCDTCTYSWRSTEPPEVTDPDRYDRRFKIDPATIPTVAEMPVIPPLRKR